MHTIKINTIEQTLDMLHNDAKKDFMRMGRGLMKSVFRPMQPSDFKDAYLPISKEQGEVMRQLIIDNDCKHIVEFGTSFGISTIYLADAARQTEGDVTTTELIESKAQKALQNITEAGLNNYVNILVGDAMLTLKDYSKPIDFLFLDGWKDLYLPLFKMLEPRFHAGTLIYADNMDMSGTQDYANYVLGRSSYTTQTVHHGKAFLTTSI
ncbi:class I SAM-dependent methyltransferase [Ichthyenterobacterium sp. W332]|uniref:Class I SAM-dependent methyltransferase n=1 Tax=Microcosmobacter mediterraneus TaxID=3075607 RepID=A0ABU2YM69_9FLAO|nr:class I SAM-dependent methyltransferase [Ichthyenterobacterium sp. W332]MDT0559231.1 class I SAM-dependent methyltransferase [Ichthyenterobacterium sp. W332]